MEEKLGWVLVVVGVGFQINACGFLQESRGGGRRERNITRALSLEGGLAGHLVIGMLFPSDLGG